MSWIRSQGFRWVAVVGWAAVIFAASSLPGSNVPGGFSVQAHFIEYFVFGWLLVRALRPPRPVTTAIVLAVLMASIYAVTDELHQALVPLRTPDWRDWLTDTVGALAGAGSAMLLDRFREARAAGVSSGGRDRPPSAGTSGSDRPQ